MRKKSPDLSKKSPMSKFSSNNVKKNAEGLH